MEKRGKRVVAIVQARTGSTRLPGKVFETIVRKPMLWHVIERLKRSKLIDDIVIATTRKEKDRQIIKLAKDLKVKSFAGSEEDVLDRYYHAAIAHKADVIVRIAADCPLIDPDVVDKVIEFFLESDFDYVSNSETVTRKPTYPEGLDTEVFSFEALEKTWREAKWLSEREHVTPYMYKHPEIFKLGGVECEEVMPDMRWTVDYKEDLKFVREVFRRLYKKGEVFRMKDVLALLNKCPRLMEINKGVKRRIGYQISLEKDKCLNNLK
jgi:spore coat polysaccharide biosynthesis protein SpsF (cytidylyltransferase family)